MELVLFLLLDYVCVSVNLEIIIKNLDLKNIFLIFLQKINLKKKKSITDKVVPLPFPNKDPIYIKRKIYCR